MENPCRYLNMFEQEELMDFDLHHTLTRERKCFMIIFKNQKENESI